MRIKKRILNRALKLFTKSQKVLKIISVCYYHKIIFSDNFDNLESNLYFFFSFHVVLIYDTLILKFENDIKILTVFEYKLFFSYSAKSFEKENSSRQEIQNFDNCSQSCQIAVETCGKKISWIIQCYCRCKVYAEM